MIFSGYIADGKESEMSVLNLLFIGDVVGKGGRTAVRTMVPELRREFNCSFVVANAENSANGSGMTAACLKEMPGVDMFTSGDHTWDQKGFESEIRDIGNLVRPANYSSLQPGCGWRRMRNPAGGEVAVIALQGKVFMKESAYCPFETAEKILKEIPLTCKCIIVDIHAEATSEKAAMAWMLDGRVTAVIGTHTHVQTNDARVLPQGTAFLSDAGMVGSNDSILGREVEAVVGKFRTGMPRRFPVCERNIRLDCAVVSYNSETGKAVSIKPVSRMFNMENIG